MKTLFIIPLVLMSLVSFPGWGLTIDDLVKREGIYFKKFTDVPFTGEVEGQSQGKFRNGLREGYWVRFHDNGQLNYRGNYKNGKKVGHWVHYYPNGQLGSKGDYKNGNRVGYWVRYWEDGTVWHLHTGTYKNDRRVSD